MADERWRVFVSHTSELRDYPVGGSYVAAVERAVSAAGHVIVDMADFPAASQASAQECISVSGVVMCWSGCWAPGTGLRSVISRTCRIRSWSSGPRPRPTSTGACLVVCVRGRSCR